MLTRFRSQDRKNEKGAILFLVAGAMVVLLGMAGLAFDLGMLYNVKTDLQNAVDAAALAGAWKLNGTSQGITDAVASAQAAANTFQFQDHPINLAYERHHLQHRARFGFRASECGHFERHGC